MHKLANKSMLRNNMDCQRFLLFDKLGSIIFKKQEQVTQKCVGCSVMLCRQIIAAILQQTGFAGGKWSFLV